MTTKKLLAPSECVIRTGRLDLRLMEVEDAQAAFETYTSDPEASKYMVFTTQTNPSEAAEYISQQRKAFDEGKTILWAIRLKDDPALVGAIELMLGDSHEGEVGFIIGRKYWGQGIVPHALKAIIDVVKWNLTIQCIFGQCDIENAKSARVFQKCGFKELEIAKGAVVHPQMGTKPRDSRRFVLELSR